MLCEFEGEVAGEVLDRRDLGEDLLQTMLEEPAERLMLDGEQVGQWLDFGNLGE